jgi:D-alanyl-D-alanine carboxypeptidase
MRRKAPPLSGFLLRWLSIICLWALLAPLPVHALGRHAAMIIDANTGNVLYDAAGNEPRYPASLTKMMTLYIVFDEIERGRLSFATKIKISERAASVAPTKLGLEPADEITVLDAVKALITKSANDMAVALGEHIGGSEARFAEMMTEKARLLGMSRTTFRNASGLPDLAQVTTARDMLTLALHLQDDFPKHYPLFAIQSFSFRGNTYSTHNGLLRSFEGTDGIKTGYTRLSGFNLVSSVHRGSKHLVGAVFGGSTAGSRNAEMRMLLSRALIKASPVKTRKPQPIFAARATPPQRVERTETTRPPVSSVAGLGANASTPAPAQPSATQSGVSITNVKTVALFPRSPAEASIERSTPAPHSYAEVTNEAAAAVTRTAADGPELSRARAPQLVGLPTQVTRRGMAPSTLQQQAENLAAGMPPLDAAAKQRVAAPQRGSFVLAASNPQVPSATGPFLVQVGAYGSAAEAEKALASALERASSVLASAAPVTAPVQMGDRQLFRARFSGFDPQSAAATCIELRRRQIDCLVVRSQ